MARGVSLADIFSSWLEQEIHLQMYRETKTTEYVAKVVQGGTPTQWNKYYSQYFRKCMWASMTTVYVAKVVQGETPTQ